MNTNSVDIDNIVALRLQLGRWLARLQWALYRLESRYRAAQNKKPLPAYQYTSILIPHTARDATSLLNLKVWCERYGVDAEFVLNALIEWQAKRLKRRPVSCYHEHIFNTNLRLQIPAAQLTSVKARQVVERAVLAAFPNGQNWSALQTPKPAQIQQIPRTKLDPTDPDATTRRYAAKILKARAQVEAEAQRQQYSHRAYRKVGMPPQLRQQQQQQNGDSE